MTTKTRGPVETKAYESCNTYDLAFVAQWADHPSGIQKVLGSSPIGDPDIFSLCPASDKQTKNDCLFVITKSYKIDNYFLIVFRPVVNGFKRPHDDDDDVIEQPVVRKPRVETEVIIIDDPTPPPPQEKEKTFEPVINDSELALEGVDNDLIIKLGKLSREEQWIKLAQSAQQLRHLRENVCKLLRVLVPEIELGEKAELLDNTTVDNLLKQVLEANLNPDAIQP